MGVDLEQAAGPAYHAIPADPHDDEAPVLGNAPPATPKEDWRLFPILLIFSFVVTVVMLGPVEYLVQTNLASFSVGLAGYDGIDVGRPGSVVSPAFNLTLRPTKACADRAEVVLTYSGVALGWARVEPRGCASREPWGRDVEVVARADGVGLSRRLRERMASEWRRSGRVEFDADVVIYNDRYPLGYLGDNTRDKVMRCKVVMTAEGIQPQPEPCPWYYLRPVMINWIRAVTYLWIKGFSDESSRNKFYRKAFYAFLWIKGVIMYEFVGNFHCNYLKDMYCRS